MTSSDERLMEHRMRTDTFRDASANPTSVTRYTCINCAKVFSSDPYREGGGVEAIAKLRQQWREHLNDPSGETVSEPVEKLYTLRDGERIARRKMCQQAEGHDFGFVTSRLPGSGGIIAREYGCKRCDVKVHFTYPMLDFELEAVGLVESAESAPRESVLREMGTVELPSKNLV